MAYLFLSNEVLIDFYQLTSSFLNKVKQICMLKGSKYEFYERKYTNNIFQ